MHGGVSVELDAATRGRTQRVNYTIGGSTDVMLNA
jgi:hypothetical protein